MFKCGLFIYSGRVIQANRRRIPDAMLPESQPNIVAPSISHHNPATAVKLTRIKAPRATQDFHCGRSRMFKNLFGCDKSLMSRITVISVNNKDVKPAAKKLAESKGKMLNITPRLNNMNIPPAIFFVTRYNGNSQCHWILCCAL